MGERAFPLEVHAGQDSIIHSMNPTVLLITATITFLSPYAARRPARHAALQFHSSFPLHSRHSALPSSSSSEATTLFYSYEFWRAFYLQSVPETLTSITFLYFKNIAKSVLGQSP